MSAHKAGFVALIGLPNVGKSTLMNALTGERLSIVTPKAQTTRQRIKGILNHDDYQIIFSDTPGILEPGYLLQEKMMDFVRQSLEDADVVLYITDTSEGYMDESLVARLKAITVPLIVIINKVDQSSPNEIGKLNAGWKKHLSPHAIIPVSALTGFNVDKVIPELLAILPEAPAYFDKENVSDASLRFFVSEIIREKIFLHYQKEIPYSTVVGIESFKDEKNIVKIGALIYVERESQKPIIIGRGGESIKRVGTESRKAIEAFLGKKVFLEIFVKVEPDWRKKESKLRKFGYSE